MCDGLHDLQDVRVNVLDETVCVNFIGKYGLGGITIFEHQLHAGFLADTLEKAARLVRELER